MIQVGVVERHAATLCLAANTLANGNVTRGFVVLVRFQWTLVAIAGR